MKKILLYTIILIITMSSYKSCCHKLEPGILNVDKTELVLENSTVKKIFTIKNIGEDNLTYTVVADNSWIKISKMQGELQKNMSDIIEVTADVASLISDSTYIGSISISSDGGQAQIIVTLYYESNGNPPTAQFSVMPEQGSLSTVFEFDASSSYDDNTPTEDLQIAWIWEDGGSSTAWTTLKTATHIYSTPGKKYVTLMVKDAEGKVGEYSKTITVVQNQAPESNFTFSPLSPHLGENVSFDASSSTDDIDSVGSLMFAWKFSDTGTYTDWSYSPDYTHTYNEPGIYSVTLKVKDSYYEEDSITKNITVLDVNLPQVLVYALYSPPGPYPVIIYHNKATVYGKIVNLGEGATEINQYGIVWSASNNMPTIDASDCQYIDYGQTTYTGIFQRTITDLQTQVTYYYRAFAKNGAGIAYSDVYSFKTTAPQPEPIVFTADITNITLTQARAFAHVQLPTDTHSYKQHGFCWSTSNTSPNISDAHYLMGVLTQNDFNYQLEGLSPDDIYYIRAFVQLDDNSYIYGDTRVFETREN